MSAAIEIDGMTVTVAHQSMWLVESAQYARQGDYKTAYHAALREIQELASELESRDEDEDS